MTLVSDGDDIDAAPINRLAAGTIEKPTGRIRQTVAQTGVTNNTLTPVTMDTEDWDDNNDHSTVTNTARVTPHKAGTYRFAGSVCFLNQTDYSGLDVVFRKNGTTTLPPATRVAPSATNTTWVLPATALIDCDGSTDYVELCFRAARSGAGTSGTAVSSFLASALEWEFVKE